MNQQAHLLRGFLAQFASKEAVDGDEDSGFEAEFLKLKRQSTKYRTDKTYPTKAAEKQDNVKKNRYKDIVPFDHTRVKLSLSTSKNDTDYINANFIKGVFGPRAYIATQGPLPNTVLDFWRMLWEYNVQIVVMACREFEMGRKKCERYWPETKVDAFVCEPFTVRCESEENKGDYVTRILRVTFNKSSRTLRQLHYMNWPDHGVPDSIPSILELLQEMRMHQEHDDIPICIHCSAGCGRTGALCAIDYTWNLLKRQIIPENFSIFNMVQEMRTQRPSVVQTKEQYELVYRAVKFLFEKYLQMMEPNTNQDKVPSAPSPIPEDSDSDLSDPEPVIETCLDPEPKLGAMYYSLQLGSEPRYRIQDLSNHVVPNVISQQLSYSPPLSPQVLTPNAVAGWAVSTTAPVSTNSTSMRQTDFGHYVSEIPEPVMRHRADAMSASVPIKPPRPKESSLSQRPLDQPVLNNVSHSAAPHQQPPIQKPVPSQRLLEQTVMNNSVAPHQPPPIQQPNPAQRSLEQTVMTSAVAPQQSPPVQKPMPSQKPLEQTVTSNAVAPHQPPPIQQPNPSQRSLEQTVMTSTVAPQQPPPVQKPVPSQGLLELTVMSNAVAPHQPPPIQQPNLSQSSPEQARMSNVSPAIGQLQPPEIKSLCLTVEDPYFGPDSPVSVDSFCSSSDDITAVDKSQKWSQNPCFSGPVLTLNDQPLEPPALEENTGMTSPSSDRDCPPPLPERTPESYILADEVTDNTSVSQNLVLIIPPETASETVNGGSPPSPAPPLPERTPESYELATDEDLVQNAVQEKPQQTVLRVGKSSEWSGNSNSDSDIMRTWSRSKSLRARLTVSLHVPAHIQPLAPLERPSEVLTQDPPPCLTPPLPARPSESCGASPASLTPPLPKRTPESFILDTQEEQSNNAPCQSSDMLHQRQRLGTSSEWAGNTQTRTFLDVMSRSKSVKVRSSKKESSSLAPLSTAAATTTVTAQRVCWSSRRAAASGRADFLSPPDQWRTNQTQLLRGHHWPKNPGQRV
ncbi:tyrosine-protein phosphatase non-receptor type 22 isoform X2 [Colossoma macropomum]|uniref:tyrosine-protein phosphatase non-receptor type 22 isoform X2 n=1 Tax=Colossoma macropomum TaxID=42526 RepID=UPI001864A8E3|nr:tyrosine-protein phosphatase non-receptor type 22 isoform X2 [Colossoma macropomum]